LRGSFLNVKAGIAQNGPFGKKKGPVLAWCGSGDGPQGDWSAIRSFWDLPATNQMDLASVT